jgi:hypothetical protein
MDGLSGTGIQTAAGLAAALLLAMAFKVALLVAGVFPFNADEAVVALMARHVLQGERPVFFYGQAYMGSLDAFLVAAGFYAFGEQVWVIRAVQTLLYLGTLLTTARIGALVFSGRRTGLLVAWLLAIPTVNLTLYTTVSLGGYGEMLLIGNLILLVALAIGQEAGQGGVREKSLWLALGLLSGLGLWAFGLTLVYSLPAVLYAGRASWRAAGTARQAGRWQRLGWQASLYLLGAIVGSAPWWGYAWSAGMTALLGELGGSAIAGVEGAPWQAKVLQHLLNLVVFGGTVITGLRPPWEVRWLALPLLPLALAVWLGGLAYAAWGLLKAPGRPVLPAFWRGDSPTGGAGAAGDRPAPVENNKPPQRKPGEWLLAVVALTLAAGFVLTPFGADPSGRYFLPLVVILSLFLARSLVDWRERWGRGIYGLAGLVLVFNLWGTLQLAGQSSTGLSTQIDGVTQIDHRYDPALVEFLRSQRETRGYTTYWIAYPLAFLSGEELIYQPRLPYHQDYRYTPRDDRYPPYARQVARAERSAYVTACLPALEARLRRSFERLGVSYQEAVIGDYHVFYRLSRHVRPEELGL